MLGQSIVMSRDSFNPYLPDHKDGFYELDQIKPGVVSCPHCCRLIDATQNIHVLAAVETLSVWPDSWASVPICNCPGVWAVYSPKTKKWAFRFQSCGTDDWKDS